MKKIIFSIVVILFISCCSIPSIPSISQKEIIFEKSSSCSSGISINGFSATQKEISNIIVYFNKIRVTENSCFVDQNLLFETKAFQPVLLYLFSDSVQIREGSFDSKEQFDEWCTEILIQINNTEFLHQICDKLIKSKKSQPIYILWDRLDKTKLFYLDFYIENANYLELAELMIIFNNQGDLLNRKLIKNKILNIANDDLFNSNDFVASVDSLIKSEKIVSREAFDNFLYSE